jgi:hypothetical protein
VDGFDPESITGVDLILMTFVNREFEIFLPFDVDTRSEGKFLELQARATIGTSELAKSSVYNLPVRRNREVETTTEVNGVRVKYKGRVIGNIVQNHEEYLVQGAFRDGDSTFQTTAVNINIPGPQNKNALPFQQYKAGDLRVIMMIDILEGATPPKEFLSNVNGVSDANRTEVHKQTKENLRNKTTQTLRDIFANAGFAGVQIFFQNDQGSSQPVTEFTNAFSRNSRGIWNLTNTRQRLTTPFWNFFVVSDETIKPVGLSERPNIEFDAQVGNRRFRLPCPVPIGSGDKNLSEPIRIRAGFFLNKITLDENSNEKKYSSVNEFNLAVNDAAAKLALVIAHEVAHNLGSMHTAINDGDALFTEQVDVPSLTIMAAGVEERSLSPEILFSNQLKVIWQTNFGIQPTFNGDNVYANKTWGNDFRTVDWSERRLRLARRFREDFSVLTTFTTGKTPPFAGAPPNVQKGTFVKSP